MQRTSVWVHKAFAAALLSIVTLTSLVAAPGHAPAADDTAAPAAATAAPAAADATPAADAAPATPGLLSVGDVAVTGFSGTTLAGETVTPGVDPVDRTFIDPNGPALRVFNAMSLGGPLAGNTMTPTVIVNVPASDIGQVFALVFDDGAGTGTPNLYAAATSAFGLNIVGPTLAPDGKPVRLKAGAPGATFMAGQFGALGNGSAGAIYKIDGITGKASYLADTAFAGAANTGAGIGGLAFDSASHSLYASDLDTGIIHRFGLNDNAALLDSYDHGVAGRKAKGLDPVPGDGSKLDLTAPAFKADDPATWGFAPPARRVDALAVHAGRLYYAVAEGPEIWSVGLKDGGFGTDARRELAVKAAKPYPITAIAFDESGRMYLAQRAPVKSPFDFGAFTDAGGDVLRYTPEQPDDPATPDLWKAEPESYGVGTVDDSRAADGGVSIQYGYQADGTIDRASCDGSIAMTGDTLKDKVAGVQFNALALVRPANVPPNQSAFIDYDGLDGDETARGHVGSALALRKCGADAGFPPVEAGGEGGFPPVEGGGDGGGGVGGGGGTFPPVEGGDAGGGGATTGDGGGGTTCLRACYLAFLPTMRRKLHLASCWPDSVKALSASWSTP